MPTADFLKLCCVGFDLVKQQASKNRFFLIFFWGWKQNHFYYFSNWKGLDIGKSVAGVLVCLPELLAFLAEVKMASEFVSWVFVFDQIMWWDW